MARKLDYRWHLRQVMAGRGMFATTDLIEPLAAARDPAVLQPGLPAGRRPARAAQPENLDGAGGHLGLLDERADRASRGRGGGPDREGCRRRSVWCRRVAPQTRPYQRRQQVTGDAASSRCARRSGRRASPASSARPSRVLTGRWPVTSCGVSPAGRAKRRRLAQALAGQAVAARRWAFPGAPRGRGSADRAAPGRCRDYLAAGLRRVRKAAAHRAAPRPGLVLRGLRPPA